jgi:hypothetical protein
MTDPASAEIAKLPTDHVNTTPTPTSETSAGSPISAPGARQRVTYAGVQLDVPTGWTVVDLTANHGFTLTMSTTPGPPLCEVRSR